MSFLSTRLTIDMAWYLSFVALESSRLELAQVGRCHVVTQGNQGKIREDNTACLDGQFLVSLKLIISTSELRCRVVEVTFLLAHLNSHSQR